MRKQSPGWIRYPLQAINYTIFMALVWYFSIAPPFEHLAPNEAVVVMAFSHVGKHLEPCHKLTQEELAALPENMRRPLRCSRERSPILIEAQMDGKPLFNKKLKSPGLYQDGSIDVFLRTEVPIGRHNFSIKMNDSVHQKGFNYQYKQKTELVPAQLMVINFNKHDGFTFKK